jgi:Putative transposase/Transposase zinc-binding domain
MIRLAHIIESFEADFLAHYRHRLRPEHYRALAAIKQCRSPASPMMQIECTGCDHHKLVPHSCGHRLCPHCQHHESQQWLERQLNKQVPAEYFLLTFTLPAELRALSFAHQRVIYDLLMRCSWETVHTFSHNDKHLRGTPGAIAVLHTNTRQLAFHPHVHLVMPAAALDAARKQWRTKQRMAKGGYLFNHTALAKVFRAKMLAGITAAGLTLPSHYPTRWVVDCKAVGTGHQALVYLGRYLYRGVIAERDIVAYDNAHVTFRYQHAKAGKLKRRTVSGADFLWLVLQHVLPKGFRRARNFGFLHPNCKRLIALLHLVLKFAPGQFTRWIKERAPMLCSCCGAVMTIVKTRIRANYGPIPIQTVVAQ